MQSGQNLKKKPKKILKKSGTIFSTLEKYINFRQVQPGQERDLEKKPGTAEIIHPTLSNGFERF